MSAMFTHRRRVVLVLGLLALIVCPQAGALAGGPPALPGAPPATVGVAGSTPGVRYVPGGLLAAFQTFFPITSNNTEETDVAVDAAGGVHAVVGAKTSDGGVRPVYYGHCAANCHLASSWSWVSLGDLGLWGGGVRLALTPSGQPRLMWYSEATLTAPVVWTYAEYNGSSWTIRAIVQSCETCAVSAGRYFGLDPQGRPRFVYNDINSQANHTGTFYRYCDSGCTNASNWHESSLSTELLADAALVYDGQSVPMLVYRANDKLLFYELVGESWAGGELYDLGYEAAFSLHRDSQGRPRLALYSGSPDNLLSYAWCNASCGSGGVWTRQEVGTAARHGLDVDLALDAQGRPHMAYNVDDFASSIYGLGYARCSGSCESAGASWTEQIVETMDQLDQVAPIPAESGCSSSYWLDVGLQASLAVDAAGNARIGYDCKHYQGGSCSIHNDITLARLAIMAAGGGATPTATRSRTPTMTRTPTVTRTHTGPTATRTRTPTRSATPSRTRTPTRTRTPGGPTDTPTRTPAARLYLPMIKKG